MAIRRRGRQGDARAPVAADALESGGRDEHEHPGLRIVEGGQPDAVRLPFGAALHVPARHQRARAPQNVLPGFELSCRGRDVGATLHDDPPRHRVERICLFGLFSRLSLFRHRTLTPLFLLSNSGAQVNRVPHPGGSGKCRFN